MYLHFLLLVFFSVFTSGAPIVNNGQLIRTFIDIAKGLDTFQLANCSLPNAVLPIADTAQQLPPPSDGLKLKYVVVGRGTQNYTCSTRNHSATPTATGATATLFDASCLAGQAPEILHSLAPIAADISSTTIDFLALLTERVASASDASLFLGEHYFTSSGVPFFDLRLSGHQNWIAAGKDAAVSAPKRQDVPWLKLKAVDGEGLKVSQSIC